jgi:hypothetical protein
VSGFLRPVGRGVKIEQGQGQQHKYVTYKVFLDPSGEISSPFPMRQE